MLSEVEASEKSHYIVPSYRQDDKFAKKMSCVNCYIIAF